MVILQPICCLDSIVRSVAQDVPDVTVLAISMLLHWIRLMMSNHFGEATFENWENEFLQMAFCVLLTVFLYQRGSSESTGRALDALTKHR